MSSEKRSESQADSCNTKEKHILFFTGNKKNEQEKDRKSQKQAYN
jgi:hypothetical protein